MCLPDIGSDAMVSKVQENAELEQSWGKFEEKSTAPSKPYKLIVKFMYTRFHVCLRIKSCWKQNVGWD